VSKTNTTSFSVHSHFHVSNITSLQLNTNISVHSHFQFKVCTHMQLRLHVMHEASVAKDASEDKNCPLRFGQAECFHCKNCWWCCNQKLTICKLCGTRECDDCINYGKAMYNGEHRCFVCEAEADPHRVWRNKVWASHRKVPMSQSELEECLKNGPPPSAIDGNKKFSLPTPMTQSELDEWMKECNFKVSVV